MIKLNRKHARMSIGCMAIAVVAAVVAVATIDLDPTMGNVAFLAFGGFAGLAIYIRFHFLKCPTCRKGVATPRWNPSSKKDVCRYCNFPMYFDDELKIHR